jgi:YD repeat-containing protein
MSRALYLIQHAVTAVVVVLSSAADPLCGQWFPGSLPTRDFTVATTLSYGAPAALYTIQSPTLAGCAPAAGFYSTGQKIAKITFTYEPLASIPLISQAISNDTDVASYNVSYEVQVPGTALKVRPKRIRLRGTAQGANSFSQGDFSYDGHGRIARIDWQYSGLAGPVVSNQRLNQATSAPQGFHATLRGPGSPGKGYNKYVYEDDQHSSQPTYYESLDQDGFTAVRYQWTSRSDGLITDVLAETFQAASCTPACGANATCCLEVGSNSTGTCFAVPSCRQLGGTTWHYEYDSEKHVTAMTTAGETQRYIYDQRGRIVGYQKPKANSTENLTLFWAEYEGGHIKAQLFFIIYPYFPEAWGFDPPSVPEHSLLV